MKKLPRREFLRLAGLAAAGSALPRTGLGASLSGAAGAAGRAVHGRRHDRPHRPDHAPLADASGSASRSSSRTSPAAAPTSPFSSSSTRAPDGYTLLYDVLHPHHQSFALQVAAVRLPARHRRRSRGSADLPLVLVINQRRAGQERHRVRRLCQSQAGQGHIRLVRRADDQPPGHRAAEDLRRLRIRPRPVSPAARQIITDLISGRVQAGVDALPNSLPHIRSGAVRALAMMSPAAQSGTSRRADHRRDHPGSRGSTPGRASARRRRRLPRSSSG